MKPSLPHRLLTLITLFSLAVMAPALAANRPFTPAKAVSPSSRIEALSPDVKALIKEAESGKAIAQFKLGLMYDAGKGVVKSGDKAAYWYRKSADLGHREAQYYIGSCYVAGKGVKQDYSQASHWFLKSANQGYVKAQTKLGALYFLGKGVTKDKSVAYFWGTIAAESGDKEALTVRDMASTHLNLAMRKDVEAQIKLWQSTHPSLR